MENSKGNTQINKRGLDDDEFVLYVLFAIFCKMVQEGYEQISLKSADVQEYVPRLEKVFTNIGIISDAFCKTPVDETYDRFKSYVIQCLVRTRHGYFNDEYNQIEIQINSFFAQKTLNENKDIMDIIESGYMSITNQMEDVMESNQLAKRFEHPSIK